MAEVTGTDLVRNALRGRQCNIANLARDLGISSQRLDAFLLGTAPLPTDAMQSLTRTLFDNAEFDAATDKLRTAKLTPVRPMGIKPDVLTNLPKYTAGPPQLAHRPEDEHLPAPKPKKRPGWLGGWL